MKKALMMASVAGMIDGFNRDNMTILQELGFQVEIACNFEYGSQNNQDRDQKFRLEMEEAGIKTYQLPVPRSPIKLRAIFRAYRKMEKICKENRYQLVHCHSPVGGVVARFACLGQRKKGTKVIYTVHGFHFFKGAPLKNWLLYYPVERFISRFTDLLITINKEDYKRAQTFHAKKVAYIPGVGIDVVKFKEAKKGRKQKRAELGIEKDQIVFLSVGELRVLKNHETAIRAMARLKNKNFTYLLVGDGDLHRYLEELAQSLGIGDHVRFLGYRQDVAEICGAADIFVFPSLREGLSVAFMEAMSAGLPVVASKIRGNADLIENGKGGYLNSPKDIEGFSKSLDKLENNSKIRRLMGERNAVEIMKYDQKIVNQKMKTLYLI